MEQTAFQHAERAQKSVLANLEKKCLVWMAQRLPRWVSSDQLTVLGILGTVGVCLSFWLARSNRTGLLLAIFCLGVNWFGDSLDGTLARVRNQPRPRYGFYVDHVVDTVGALLLVGGIVLSGYMTIPFAAAALLAFYILSTEVYLAAYTIGTFHLSFGGVGPTEMRILLAFGCSWLFFHPRLPLVYVLGRTYLLLDVSGAIAAFGMLMMFFAAAARHTRLLYRAEPLARQ